MHVVSRTASCVHAWQLEATCFASELALKAASASELDLLSELNEAHIVRFKLQSFIFKMNFSYVISIQAQVHKS